MMRNCHVSLISTVIKGGKPQSSNLLISREHRVERGKIVKYRHEIKSGEYRGQH